MSKLFFIIAGEKSGDKLGADLISSLKSTNPNFIFSGVGGPLMKAEGLKSIFSMDELSLMGIFEILPKLPKLFRLRDKIVESILLAKPLCLITIDSPEFSFRVAQKVKRFDPNLKVVHYVAPSVWAWRPKRGLKISKFVNHILALFPFEPEIMHEFGISCDFVGHPISLMPKYSSNKLAEIRKKFDIGKTEKLIVLLPGSRVSEINRLLPIFIKTLEVVTSRLSNIKIIVPTLPHTEKRVSELLKSTKIKIKLFSDFNSDSKTFEEEKFELFAAANVALAASGTVTLELAAARTPMVVGYDVNFFTRLIIKSLLKIDDVSLVNILLKRTLIPEFIGKKCKPDLIANSLLELIENKTVYSQQKVGLVEVIEKLGNEKINLGKGAAYSVCNFLRIKS